MHTSTRIWFRKSWNRRGGFTMVKLLILLPALFGVLGVVIDGGLLMLESRRAQGVADAAAAAAATELRLKRGPTAARDAAELEVWIHNGMDACQVTVNCPPTSGSFAGDANYAEVLLRQPVGLHLIHLLGGGLSQDVTARAVAGVEPATAEAALVALDPSPEPLNIAPLPLALPALPSLLGGVEVLGVGQVDINGAIHVNNQWGGVDEHGEPAGDEAGAPYAVAAMPLIGLSSLRALDLRVVGGVDNPARYGNVNAGEESPLRAGRLAVPDPYAEMPVPTLASDPVNVSATNYGGKTIVGLPLGPPVTLSPGVYDWIDVVTGRVVFEPGVYIIRGRHPVTKHSLLLTAGTIQAEGVMFYLTNTAAYSPASGLPDALDGETEPASLGLGQVVPSVVINAGLLNSRFSPLNSPGSPYHGMLFFQRRHDRRPLVFVQQNLLLGGSFAGNIYAKWGHVILAGKGDYDSAIVAGTMRLIALLDMEITPSRPLPPAYDVFLVE